MGYHSQKVFIYIINYIYKYKVVFRLEETMFFNCSTVACSRFVNPFRLRAFSRVFLANKFGNDLKFLYLCNVKEKRRNLLPAWTTKIS